MTSPAVYETMRVKGGRVPFLTQHLVRLQRNASTLGLGDPVGADEQAREALRSADPESALRLEWDGTRLTVRQQPLRSNEPMAAVTSAVPHGGYAVKTTQRAAFDRARSEARTAGADEAILLTPEGYVAEGTLFAVAWIRGDDLVLPSLELGILPSIGRDRLIELAATLGVPTHQGAFERAALDCQPVFGVTSVRGVLAIASLDGAPVPDHPTITRFRDAFWPAY